VLAAALGATAYIAADLMRSLAEDAGRRFPEPLQIMAVQAGLGFILGWIVPELYRRARARPDGERGREECEARGAAAAEHHAFAW
jgi:hypothetical protein